MSKAKVARTPRPENEPAAIYARKSTDQHVTDEEK